jgi:hypothetical protein
MSSSLAAANTRIPFSLPLNNGATLSVVHANEYTRNDEQMPIGHGG